MIGRAGQFGSFVNKTLYERLEEVDRTRGLALGISDSYNRASAENAYFRLHEEVGNVVSTMPLFTDTVATRLAEKEADTVRAATLSSIYAKIKQGGTKDFAEIIAFAKTQKKDTLYGKTTQ